MINEKVKFVCIISILVLGQFWRGICQMTNDGSNCLIILEDNNSY